MRLLSRVLLLTVASILLLTADLTSEPRPVPSSNGTQPAPTVIASPGAACTPILMWRAYGDSAGDMLGYGLAGGGDIDGDAKPDILAGSHTADRLGVNGMGIVRGWYSNFELEFEKYGDDESVGDAVAFAGDVDGDGRDEIIAGGRYADVSPYVTRSGIAHIYDGSGGIIATIGPYGNNEDLGASVDGVGDVDGDGFDDVMVGAPFGPGLLGLDEGYVLLYSPKLHTILRRFDGLTGGDEFGQSSSRAGFVNGDANEDVVIGALYAFVAGVGGGSRPGSAFVYSTDGTLIWRFNGDADSMRFGVDVSGAGDVNNDGYDDVVVGADMADPNGVTNAGSAFVYSGVDGSLLWRFDGNSGLRSLGRSVAGAGDIDNDGYDDVVVGAPYSAGAVVVYSGRTGEILWLLNGESAGDWFGHRVASAGDINGDGHPEILVSAILDDPIGRAEAGTVYLYGCPVAAPAPIIQEYPGSPCTPSLIWQSDGNAPGDYFGFSVSGDGDWNGDGEEDIAVGALLADEGLGASGSASVFHNNLVDEWDYYWNLNADFGRSIRFLGDMDDDGADECLIGAPGESAAGSDSCGAVIVWGTVTGWKFSWIGNGTGDKLGYCVDFVGDADGDDHDDIIAGAPEGDGLLAGNTGYALLLNPRTNSLIRTFYGGEPDSRFGHAVAYAGSIAEGAGYSLLIGAPLASPPGPVPIHSGAVFAYEYDGTLIWRINGESPNDYFGCAVSGTSDLNGDNINEIIVGARYADPGGITNAGSVYVYSVASKSLLYRVDGTDVGGSFGYSVQGICDVNHDGYDDFVVGALYENPDSRKDAGSAYVCSGVDGEILWKISGGAAGDLLGVDVAFRADPTQFNYCQVIVGAFKTDPGSRINAGSAYLFGCACDCPCSGDPGCDGVTNVVDVVNTINVAFRGGQSTTTGNCPYENADVDCSGACSIVDVVKMVNVAFRGADKATEFCSPCQ